MSRPKPTVLLEITNKKTYKTEQVLDAEAIWAVFYKDKPINLKLTVLLHNKLDQNTKRLVFQIVVTHLI